MSRVRRALGVLAVVVVALVGCTGGTGDPGPTSSPVDPTPAVTPSPTPTVELWRLPERPAEMDEPTTEGATAAATYVLDLFPYTFVTRDTTAWEAITRETCQYCAGVVADVRDMRAERHKVRGGAITVLSATATEIREDAWFGVELVVSQDPSERVDSEGNVIDPNPGGEFDVAFALSWDGRWHVDEMGVEAVALASEAVS